MKKYDAVIIGTGQAGPSLAAQLAGSGQKTAIIERHLFGGTCVNDGCTPTKTLVASARAAHMARRAADFGVLINSKVMVDMKKVMARKNAIVAKSNTGVEGWLKNTPNLDVYEADATFIDVHTLQVGQEQIQAQQIFINVGGRPRVDEHVKAPYFTNTTLLQVGFLPKHLVIVGGSYIGLEFAQIFRRFGSEVTVVEKHSRLVSREDPDVSATIQDILTNEGINLRLEAECISATQEGDEVLVNVVCKEGPPVIRGSHLVAAIGRVPNTDTLGLDKAGVTTNSQGYITVNDVFSTSFQRPNR